MERETVFLMPDGGIISSIRLVEGPGHDHLHVWNHGGKAGTLVVNKGQGKLVADLLMPSPARIVRVDS